MNFEAVLHYKHQNQARDEKKKLRHASGANITSTTTAATTAATATATATSTEGSNSESEAESTENSPTPSPLQKKVTEVPYPSSLPEDRPRRQALSGVGRWGAPRNLGFPEKCPVQLDDVACLPSAVVPDGALMCGFVFEALLWPQSRRLSFLSFFP